MKVQIAIAANGDLHIWRGDSMPPAANLVDFEIDRAGGMMVIPADRTGPLREVLGTGAVAAQASGPGGRRLERILRMAEALSDEIRTEVEGDLDDEDLPKPPGF